MTYETMTIDDAERIAARATALIADGWMIATAGRGTPPRITEGMVWAVMQAVAERVPAPEAQREGET